MYKILSTILLLITFPSISNGTTSDENLRDFQRFPPLRSNLRERFDAFHLLQENLRKQVDTATFVINYARKLGANPKEIKKAEQLFFKTVDGKSLFGESHRQNVKVFYTLFTQQPPDLDSSIQFSQRVPSDHPSFILAGEFLTWNLNSIKDMRKNVESLAEHIFLTHQMATKEQESFEKFYYLSAFRGDPERYTLMKDNFTISQGGVALDLQLCSKTAKPLIHNDPHCLMHFGIQENPVPFSLTIQQNDINNSFDHYYLINPLTTPLTQEECDISEIDKTKLELETFVSHQKEMLKLENLYTDLNAFVKKKFNQEMHTIPYGGDLFHQAPIYTKDPHNLEMRNANLLISEDSIHEVLKYFEQKQLADPTEVFPFPDMIPDPSGDIVKPPNHVSFLENEADLELRRLIGEFYLTP